MKGTADMVAHKQRQRDRRPSKKPVPLANSQSISQYHKNHPDYNHALKYPDDLVCRAN